VLEPSEAAEVAERLRAAGDEKSGGDYLFHDGMERFAGHYDTQPGSLLDYLPAGTLVVRDDPGALAQRAEELEELIARGFDEARRHYPAVPPPRDLFLPGEALAAAAARHAGADWRGAIAGAGEAARSARTLLVDCVPAEPMQRSIERLKSHLAEL